MKAITNKIGHFLATNTLWIFLAVIAFVSYIRILILRNPVTSESVVYLEIEKWQLYGQFIFGHAILFAPVLLFSFFRKALQKHLSKPVLILLWGYCFIGHGFLLFKYNIAHIYEPLRAQVDTPVIFGIALLVVELIIHFNDYLISKLRISQRLKQLNIEKTLLLLVLLAALYWTYATTAGEDLQIAIVTFCKWLVLFFTCYAFYWINHYILIEQVFKRKGVFYYLLSFVGLALLFFPIAALLYKYVHFQSNQLAASAWIPKGERMTNFYVFPGDTVWAWMYYSIPIIVVYQWWKQKNDITQLEKEKSTAELNALKQQINPHFLFNTLNSLYALGIEEKGEKTADGIAKLGILMRYNLNDSQKKFIPLSKEIDYIKKYIELQELRLTKNNQLSVNFLGEIADKQIAPLLLIPFIENAFKFGVSSTEKTKIDLTLTMEEGVLKMHLFNTIIRNRQMPEGNGIGISNTRKRLAHLYPSQYELIIEETADEFEVHLEIELA